MAENSVTARQHEEMIKLCARCLDGQRRVTPADGALLPPGTASSAQNGALRPPSSVPLEAAEALRCQIYQRRHKKRDGEMKRKADKLVARWRRGETILAMARDAKFSPAALARILVSELCLRQGRGGVGGGATAVQVSSRVDAGAPSAAAAAASAQRASTTSGKRDPLTKNQRKRLTLLMRGGPDAPELVVNYGRGAGADAEAARRLRRELDEAVDADMECGPVADHIRHSIGIEYEYVLQEKLRDRAIAFLSEGELRQRDKLGKTPDAKLTAPIGVQGANGCWHEVNWIDSKAQFGDPETHAENIEQLWCYHNRFGPGMVIYWFGFVETLNDGAKLPCLATGGFPENVITI